MRPLTGGRGGVSSFVTSHMRGFDFVGGSSSLNVVGAHMLSLVGLVWACLLSHVRVRVGGLVVSSCTSQLKGVMFSCSLWVLAGSLPVFSGGSARFLYRCSGKGRLGGEVTRGNNNQVGRSPHSRTQTVHPTPGACRARRREPCQRERTRSRQLQARRGTGSPG